MVCTTNISPITVMAVVDVVGVIPNTQTSAGLPVLRQTSDSFCQRTIRISGDNDKLQIWVQIMSQTG